MRHCVVETVTVFILCLLLSEGNGLVDVDLSEEDEGGLKDFLSTADKVKAHDGDGSGFPAEDNTKDSGKHAYFLSIGAVFRDEDAFLVEWIEFHLCAGVDHFFLYNHMSSSDSHVAILQPYVDQGMVTLEQAVCDQHCQVPTYEACVRDHGASTHWLAFIDIDEFLFPHSPTELYLPSILLRQYQGQWGGVCVHWIVYGSSGHKHLPTGLVIESFIQRSPEVHQVIKTIFQPSKVAVVAAHNHVYKEGWDAVNERFDRVHFNHTIGEPASTLPFPSADVFRINHYRVKSLSHARWRYLRDSTFRLNDFDNPDVFPETEADHEAWIARWDMGGLEDASAAKYAGCVRQGMVKRASSSHGLPLAEPHDGEL